MVLLKPLLTFLKGLIRVFDVPKSEIPCRVPVKVREQKRK